MVSSPAVNHYRRVSTDSQGPASLTCHTPTHTATPTHNLLSTMTLTLSNVPIIPAKMVSWMLDLYMQPTTEYPSVFLYPICSISEITMNLDTFSCIETRSETIITDNTKSIYQARLVSQPILARIVGALLLLNDFFPPHIIYFSKAKCENCAKSTC